MKGRIINVNKEKRYGFIRTQNNNQGDVYFTLSSFKGENGQTVYFETFIRSDGRKQAKNIRLIERNEVLHNTEDKDWWALFGKEKEINFINEIVPKIGRNIIINPEKDQNDKAIDLLDIDNNRFADLKTQCTPFFTIAKKSKKFKKKYDPTYTVAFNVKDYKNYKRKHPDCDIYFWVNWKQLEGYGVVVDEIKGVWVANFADMCREIESGNLFRRDYDNRTDDDINAKDSYYFDLRDENLFKKIL